MKEDCVRTISLQEEKLYAFYLRESYPSHFFVGEMIQRDWNNEILIKLIAPDGASDGFLLFSFACAYRIEKDSIYLRALENKVKHNQIIINFGETAWDTLLRYAKEQEIAVQLRDRKWKRLVSGFVVDFTAQNMIVQRIKKSGKIGQSRSYRRERIGFLFCGSDSEIALMHLYQETQHER